MSQPVCATPGPWKISEVRSVEGEYLIVGGVGQDFGMVASVPEKADAELIVALQAQIADRDRTIDVLEANARVQAKLLADTGRRVDDLTKALQFYADARRYQGANQHPIPNDPYAKPDAAYIMDVTRDGGAIAYRALRVPLEDRK